MPELDAVHEGEPATSDLSERITECLRLDYFDNETRGLFRLLGEEARDQRGVHHAPVEVDYEDMRSRAVNYRQQEIEWPLHHA